MRHVKTHIAWALLALLLVWPSCKAYSQKDSTITWAPTAGPNTAAELVNAWVTLGKPDTTFLLRRIAINKAINATVERDAWQVFAKEQNEALGDCRADSVMIKGRVRDLTRQRNGLGLLGLLALIFGVLK